MPGPDMRPEQQERWRASNSVYTRGSLYGSPSSTTMSLLPVQREHRLLPIALAYLPVPVVGAVLSIVWGVGATPDGGPADLHGGTDLTIGSRQRWLIASG